MRRAVQRFKYHGEFQRGYDLGRRLQVRASQLILAPRVDAVVPVPLHTRRLRSRGFNQAAILAESIAPAFDAPVHDIVRRVRNTSPQVSLRADDRSGNVANAFALAEDADATLKGRAILIVDDVTTTGATFSAVASALQEGGVESIYALALAREQ